MNKKCEKDERKLYEEKIKRIIYFKIKRKRHIIYNFHKIYNNSAHNSTAI